MRLTMGCQAQARDRFRDLRAEPRGTPSGVQGPRRYLIRAGPDPVHWTYPIPTLPIGSGSRAPQLNLRGQPRSPTL
jgi:hypothetical protein